MTKSNLVHCLQDDIGFVELVKKDVDEQALSVVNAARCSYGKESEEFTDKDKKLTGYLWTHEHTSPFRHTTFRFHIKVPLFVFRQWTKYQVGCAWRKYEIDGDPVSFAAFDLFYDTDKGCSWNELSGRYKEMDPEFYVPHRLRGNPGHGISKQSSGELDWDSVRMEGYKKNLRDKFRSDYRHYTSMLQDGVAKEIARTTLPQSIYTEAYWTVSLQALLHFLHQRLKPDAQFEIRHCALAVYDLTKDVITDKLGITYEQIVA